MALYVILGIILVAQLYVAEGVYFVKVPARGWRMGFKDLPMHVHKNGYLGALLTVSLIVISLVIGVLTLV